MALLKVLDEKIPYHARIYPMYSPIKGFVRGSTVYYSEELQNETDDMIEDLDMNDYNDKKNEYHEGKVPPAKIERAFKDVDEDFEGYEMLDDDILHHSSYSILNHLVEHRLRENNLSINFFKIMHIWSISLNNKSDYLSWSAKFESSTKNVELEIQSHDKVENDSSHTKVVGFFLDSKECDSVKSATVDGYEVKYLLFSNAYRVKFEIRSYNDDGSPALNVKGRVRVYFKLGGKNYENYIFGGEKYKTSEHLDGHDTCIICPALILPCNLSKFRLDVSLNDDVGNFAFNDDKVFIVRRSIAVDEELHNVGEKGYIILTAIWACLCVDLEHGICTCPGTAVGFEAENVDNGEVRVTKYEATSDASHPITTHSAVGTGVKRTKVYALVLVMLLGFKQKMLTMVMFKLPNTKQSATLVAQ